MTSGARFPALLLSLGIACLLCALAHAAPPEAADPNSEVGHWFQSLKQPDTGISCCSIADCRPVDDRISGDGYEAYIDDQWVKIPPEKVLHQENIMARAILCRSSVSEKIWCFLPGAET